MKIVLVPALLASAGAAFSADFPLVVKNQTTSIIVDANESEVVRIAAGLLADDVQQITGSRPTVAPAISLSPSVIFAGTLGKSKVIDDLAAKGKLKDLKKIQGHWEATLWQVVEHPVPGVDRALVIAGSDRRGTAYGLTKLSEEIGVSPWTWWADIPAPHRDKLSVKVPAQVDSPAVKYRGIFINDEDWGLHQWANKTFEPENKSIGPKTYAKLFELMLRLRLNYLWPAMHNCTREFDSIPENMELAQRYGIVAGASHCEPMLYNNAKWNESKGGKWNYTLNRNTIFSTWENEAKTRGDKEAVWGIGIRGIHDQGMQGPPDVSTRLGIVSEVFKDQRRLIDQYVTKEFGTVSQAFVPYKEVLPLYDAGLSVPDDVTIVWVDDNFGYIRRLGAPAERKRSGGAGLYWHLSYYGFPHSYTWINTTAPALMWEEFDKAWENDTRNLWVINVGDLKPMEIGVDYFSKLAWNPEGVGPDSQPKFLKEFSEQQFGKKLAGPVANLLTEFYRLGTIRKPELMNREWATSLPDPVAKQLRTEYRRLLETEAKLFDQIPSELKDGYYEMVGFPARVIAASGLLFLADRDAQFGISATESNAEIARQREYLEKQVSFYNNQVAGGKWKNVMPGLVTGSNLTAWNSQVRWPWGEKSADVTKKPTEALVWRDAATADERSEAGSAKWTTVPGLGQTGRAVALKPASLSSSWGQYDPNSPALTYNFKAKGGDGELAIDFLPTFRIYPGMQLRVSVTVDDGTPIVVEVPGSSGKEDENGANRRFGVQNNFVRAKVTLPGLEAGKHVLKIRAIDPGVVIDRISLPKS